MAILIAGCGGGYDLFTGLPLYFELQQKHADIHLMSLTLSARKNTDAEDEKRFPNGLSKITYHEGTTTDNAEQLLSRALNGTSIYCIEENGLKQMTECYRALVSMLKIETVYLCDGGCDSLLSGKETDGHLGTPVEDMMSIFIVRRLLNEQNIKDAKLVCLGTTVDTFGDIRYSDYQANLEQLRKSGALLSERVLSKKDPNVEKYIDIFKQCEPSKSCVNSCIVAGLEGQYGKEKPVLLGERIRFGNWNITPEVHTQFVFDLLRVAQHVAYLNELDQYDSSDQIDEFIVRFNRSVHAV